MLFNKWLISPVISRANGIPHGVVLPRESEAECDSKKGKFSASIHNQQPWEKEYTWTKIKGWWIDN
jgi:hypothetical protein